MIKASISLFLAISSSQLLAFPCYFTLAKDSCWVNYNVKVDVLDATANKTLATVEVPQGQSWARQSFECHPEQKLIYHATFSPAFWQSEKGKTYPALRYWFLPGSVQPGQIAWEIPVCYPSDFATVPFPPDASGNCKCDFQSIPPIKPQAIPASKPQQPQTQ